MFWENSDRIAELRMKQDALNIEISQLLLQRLKLSLEIIQEKAKKGEGVKDPLRESEIITNITEGKNLTETEKQFITEVFRTILDESCKIASK